MSQDFRKACSLGDLEKMKQLLADGADIDFTRYNSTALHSASSSGSLKVLRFLIQNGASLDLLDDSGCTALMIACNRGKKIGGRMAMTLLDAGADATYVRKDGMSALKFALWGACSDEVLQALIDAGAELPDKDFKIIRVR